MLVLAGDFCAQTANIWYLLGHIVNIIKIVIPLILIILGMVDLGKAVVSSDDKAISKSVSALIKRFIAAVIVFFVPTIVSALFSAISSVNLNSGDAQICIQCLVNNGGTTPFGPGNKTCEGYKAEALGGV